MLGELAGPETIEATLSRLDAVAPGFPDWIVTALFGGTYQREGLALRDRQIANLAALAALGGVEPQLDDHVRNSLRIGIEPREIVEVMVHLAPYIGVPKALAGLRVVTAALGKDAVGKDTRITLDGGTSNFPQSRSRTSGAAAAANPARALSAEWIDG
nr:MULTISPECIES: carboxymuconolactone decarboxylase family protein [unclassified Streptomyces]